MSSPEPNGRDARQREVAQLLDLAFGFFAWAGHFLVIYTSTAVACLLGLGMASTGARSAFIAVMAVFTLAVAVLVLGHALSRWRRLRDRPETTFRRVVTIGGDAIAALAILWQLYALLLLPICV